MSMKVIYSCDIISLVIFRIRRLERKYMKRFHSIVVIALLSALALTGCKKESETVKPNIVEPVIDENIDSANPSATASNTDDVTKAVDDDLPPHEGMVRSRITNEWVDEEQNLSRPVAIMVPNSNTASHYGLSNASVLYECNVEGSMTRLMAIVDDWQSLSKLGNIRSSRDYYVYWAFEWDAIYIHYGGPFYIDEVISRDDTQNINCLNYAEGSFRDESAKNSTDNSFTDARRIKKAMDHFGYSEEYREGYADEQHYKFATLPNTLDQYEDAITATKIDMSKCFPVTNCYFVYNEETGLYDRYQKVSGGSDSPHVDMANNQQLTFKNIIVQNTYHEVRDSKGYLAFQVHDTTRDGWFFTNGKGVHINWKKETDYGATRYYDDAGNEIEFNTGKTMVLIVESGDSFTVDNKAIASKE